VKRGAVIALVNRTFGICSREFLESELLYLMNILFGKSYPIKFFDKKKIKNRCIKHNNRATGVSEYTELNMLEKCHFFALCTYFGGDA